MKVFQRGVTDVIMESDGRKTHNVQARFIENETTVSKFFWFHLQKSIPMKQSDFSCSHSYL